MKNLNEKYRGCLLGGAIGDALGYPVEFFTYRDIKNMYGENGINDLITSENGKAEITDDTQMTLFTAEGILTAIEGGVPDNISTYVYQAYLAWLYTQGECESDIQFISSWLLEIKELFARRAPGNTCIGALKSGMMGSIEKPINNSKGCGAVMRVAPIGLTYKSSTAFRLACQCGAITHGHPSGYISAGIFAAIISEILCGREIEEAVKVGLSLARNYEGHEECNRAINKALSLAKSSVSHQEAIMEIGQGWVGEEALGIAIYCAMKYKNDLRKALLAAVNHDGDSDSTGAITGNILGTYLGIEKIPKAWIEQLELAEVIAEVADDIYNCKTTRL